MYSVNVIYIQLQLLLKLMLEILLPQACTDIEDLTSMAYTLMPVPRQSYNHIASMHYILTYSLSNTCNISFHIQVCISMASIALIQVYIINTFSFNTL